NELNSKSREVVNVFNSGRTVDALNANFEEVILAETLRQAGKLVSKVDKLQKMIKRVTVSDYQANVAKKIHPESIAVLRNILQAVQDKEPLVIQAVPNTPVVALDCIAIMAQVFKNQVV